MQTILAIALIAAAPKSSGLQTSASLCHTIFVVGTSGSVYRRGYLRGEYRNYVRDQLLTLPRGSSATCIAYDSDAGFYPSNTALTGPSDVLSPLGDELESTRAYWKTQYRAKHGVLDHCTRSGSRLDKALDLVMEERQAWPKSASVTLFFVTDGGVDWVGTNGTTVRHAINSIQSDFATLCRDPRVSRVVVAGVTDQPGSRFPNMFFGDRTIEEQWRYHWLKGVANAEFVRLAE